jgi:hypothetical protein
MEKIVMGFGGMGFVVNVRCFGGMKIMSKLVSDYQKAICSGRLWD